MKDRIDCYGLRAGFVDDLLVIVDGDLRWDARIGPSPDEQEFSPPCEKLSEVRINCVDRRDFRPFGEFDIGIEVDWTRLVSSLDP